MMDRASFRDFLAGGVLTLALFAPSQAQAACEREADARGPGSSEQALQSWQASRGIALTEAANERLLADLCVAVDTVAGEGTPRRAVEAAADEALLEYLDASIEPGQNGTSLTDRLAMNFQLNARPALPEPRTLGVVEIRYVKAVDRLRVGGRSLPAWPRLMAELGRVTIEGLKGNAALCRGSVLVQRAIIARFEC